jgi:glutathione S-transferase
VLATLEEKAAGYRIAPLTIASMQSPEYLALHPFGRMPAIEHDGFRLYETQAILRYIDRVCPSPALTPADPRAAARMDQAMNINDWYLFPGVANVIAFQRVVKPRLMNMPPDEEAIAAALPAARRVFNELGRLLGNQAYMAGELSLADLLIAPQIDFFAQTPEWEQLGAPHANLVAWLARVNARPSFAATTWARVSEMAKAA